MMPPPDRLYRRLVREAEAAGLPSGPGVDTPVGEADLADLPPLVRRYMRFMGVVDRPRAWSFRARFVGRFRMRPGMSWLPAEAWQYNTAHPIGRIFVLRVRFARVMPMTGKDTYVHGHGRMLGKLLGLVPVADGKGEEFDIGELTTYLNDALLMAPTFLLRPEATWVEVDADTFEVTLTDAGCRVSGRVFLDERGAPVDFASTDRFAALAGGLRRAEWRTPVSRWVTEHGRPVPTELSALWKLAEGDFSYIEGHLDPDSMAFNVVPAGDQKSSPA